MGPADATLVDAVADSEALALVTADDVWLLTPREETYKEAGSDLDSSLIALVVDQIPGVTTTYHHDWHSAIAAVNAGEAGAAVLIRPGDGGPDRRMGPRPPADAAQEHLLPPEAPDRDGVPARRLTQDRVRPRPGKPEEQGRRGDPPGRSGPAASMRRTRPVPVPPWWASDPAYRLGSVALDLSAR